MSEVPPSLSGVWNPWADLVHLAHVTLTFAHLPGDQTGETCYSTHTITLDRRLLQRERNDAIAHERIHLERGPAIAGFEEHEERLVEEETARRLIPIGALLHALAWSRDLHELAEDLHCTPETVEIRLRSMCHPAERAAVKRLLLDLEESA